jgi:tetratricopeptide (TPR) repeat protein
MPGADHFRSDEFRPLLDVCYRREEDVLPQNEPTEGELVFDWARFRALLDKSQEDYLPEAGAKELDQDTKIEINQVLQFFAGIRPNEYDGDLRKRRRWERIVCLHLLTICFIGTFGYSWQRKPKYVDGKREEAISALVNEALTMQGNDTANAISVLEAFRDNLYMTGMESRKRINRITRRQISKLEHDLTRAIDGLAQMSADARSLEDQAFRVTEQVLGPDHLRTALRLGNLARTYHALGRPAEALPLEQRALQITEQVLGPDHPRTALRLGNLACTYHALGRPAEALPLEQRAHQVAITDGAAVAPRHRHTVNRGLGTAQVIWAALPSARRTPTTIHTRDPGA